MEKKIRKRIPLILVKRNYGRMEEKLHAGRK
jgi:hypothetical protein